MPCFSTVTQTKMTDAGRVEAAMRAEGYQIISSDADRVHGRKGREDLVFSRSRAGGAFSTTSNADDSIKGVQRKYSEIGVREWAKRSGFSVAGVENKGRKLTLKNRRG